MVVLLCACMGNIESPAGSTDRAQSGDALRCRTRSVGETPMRRLTHQEYDNAVRELLGDESQPAHLFPSDTQIGLFDNATAAQPVSVLLAEQYLAAAESLALAADVADLAGCSSFDGDQGLACASRFIAQFGRRAYRRPLSDEEQARLEAVFTTTRDQVDGQSGLRAVLSAVLASPLFLYRPEFGEGEQLLPAATRAGSFELAARLASLLWASIPDEELLDAAEQGELQTRADVERQARRMLEDERAKPALAQFYDQWLGLGRLGAVTKDPQVYPEYDAALRDAMLEETERFVAHVLWEDDARLTSLLTASYSFVNPALAALYGVEAAGEDDDFARVELDPAERAGVLTQASILSAYARPDQSSPIKRGEWVRTRLLCQELPPPPPGIPDLPALEEGLSNRERFAQHTANPACSSCHGMIDGLGFGLEHYDGIGRFRAEDGDVQVDARGQIAATRDIDGEFDGAPALAARLAASSQVRDCVPTQWFRYAMGRHEGSDDACSLSTLTQAFTKSNGDLRELMVALTQTDAFWHYRAPAEQ
jgi:hypothetical protein